MTETPIIETRDLRKRYDGVDALRGLTLAVPAGSICGFLGRNGAGKSTTLKVLMGMVRPDSGRARVFGLAAGAAVDGVAIRRRAAFVSEEKDLYGYMTGAEMLRFTAAFFPAWRVDLERRYVQRFALPLHQRIKALSRGTRTKLALVLALCRGAELLLLDEPTSGLDPAAQEEVLQALVAHVASEAMTVFFSTHQIADIDQIADRVVIIHRGRTLVAGALDDLREQFRRIELVFEGEAPEATFRAPGVERVWRSGRVLTVLSSAGARALLDEARAFGPVATDVRPVTLKEIFLETAAAED